MSSFCAIAVVEIAAASGRHGIARCGTCTVASLSAKPAACAPSRALPCWHTTAPDEVGAPAPFSLEAASEAWIDRLSSTKGGALGIWRRLSYALSGNASGTHAIPIDSDETRIAPTEHASRGAPEACVTLPDVCAVGCGGTGAADVCEASSSGAADASRRGDGAAAAGAADDAYGRKRQPNGAASHAAWQTTWTSCACGPACASPCVAAGKPANDRAQTCTAASPSARLASAVPSEPALCSHTTAPVANDASSPSCHGGAWRSLLGT